MLFVVVCCLFACLFVFLFVCLLVGWLVVCLLVVVGVVVVAVVVAVAVAVFRIVAVPLSFVVHCSLHRSRCPAPFFGKTTLLYTYGAPRSGKFLKPCMVIFLSSLSLSLKFRVRVSLFYSDFFPVSMFHIQRSYFSCLFVFSS